MRSPETLYLKSSLLFSLSNVNFKPSTPPGQLNSAPAFGTLRSARIAADGDVLLPEPPEEVVRFYTITLPHPGGAYSTYAVGPDGNLLIPVRIRETQETGNLMGTAAPDLADGLTFLRNWEAPLKRGR